MLYKESLPTPKHSCEEIVEFIVRKYQLLKQRFAIESIGIGVPGVIKDGLVYIDNLPMKNVPLSALLKKRR